MEFPNYDPANLHLSFSTSVHSLPLPYHPFNICRLLSILAGALRIIVPFSFQISIYSTMLYKGGIYRLRALHAPATGRAIWEQGLVGFASADLICVFIPIHFRLPNLNNCASHLP